MNLFHKIFRHVFALAITCSPAISIAEYEPPAELPPITVVAMNGIYGPSIICQGQECESFLGSLQYDLYVDQAALLEEGGNSSMIVVSITDIPNNPANQETNASCSAIGEIRAAHARQDVALVLQTVDIGDVVRVHYDNGDTELFTIICKICTPIVKLIPNSCKVAP
jgi:hypothetical protein